MQCLRTSWSSARRAMSRHLSLNTLYREKPVQVPKDLKVDLTAQEDQLFGLLDECKQQLESEGLNVECRIAGGWVRDKLLGAQSNDIDVALANIMGVSFAEHFVKYVSSKDLPVKSVTTIERNPDQSKHLETARTTVLGVELDFVNLRSESYASGSRIPTEVKLGTPLEDALRRDTTMNALFYNVHSREVEDQTGKGLDDLRNGILRTPLPPFETFRDDPLRVIRCIRFASRFGFQMVKEIEEAMQNEEIQAAIVSKISRERVGEEFDKMMKGRDPLYSIRLVHRLNLQSAILAVPASTSSNFSEQPADSSKSLALATIINALISPNFSDVFQLPSPHSLLLSQLSRDATLRPRLFLASVLSPYTNVIYSPPKKKSTIPAAEIVIREALKLGLQNHYVDGVPALLASAELLKGVNEEQFDGPRSRSKIGLLLRTKSVHNVNTGSHWTSSILFSMAQELSALWDMKEDSFDIERARPILERYNRFVNRVEKLGLPEAIDDKPILNGKEIVSILGASQPGPWTGTVLSLISEWALDNPQGTKEDCIVWLKAEHAADRIVIPVAKGNKTPPSKKLKTEVP